MFLAICLVTSALTLAIAYLTRGITFYGANTDNAKQVFTAARSGEWRWPSEMHRYVDGGVRTRMKDVAILGLAVAQRLLRDRRSDYPLVMLCVAAHAVSAVLAFLIAAVYWNTAVGLLVWGLMITCLWSYQLALFGAPVCVAQMFCLAAVALFQAAEVWPVCHAAAGAAAGLMMFSSAASRKYLPLVVGAFLYSQRQVLGWTGVMAGQAAPALPAVLSVGCVVLSALLLVGALGLRVTYRRIVTALYNGRGPRWLRRSLMEGRQETDLERYLAHADELVSPMVTFCLLMALGLIVSLAAGPSIAFYQSGFSAAAGFGLVVLGLTVPDVLSNLAAYYRHAQGWKHNRFSLYRAYFERIGKPIPEGMRGAGWRWIVRYFIRIIPIHAALYGAACVALLVAILPTQHFSWHAMWPAVVVFVLSLSPILFGELTHGPQMSRSYYPSFLGLLLGIGVAAFHADQQLPPQARTVCWAAGAAAVFASAAWTAWMLLTDVWPARMAPAWLARTLQALGANEVATYDTPYNDAFTGALPASIKSQCAIRLISSLEEASSGYVVVPGSSAKAFNMESSRWAIEHGDFRLDPILSRLIDSKAITRYAVASFKTFGTSRFWVHESEVMSYRDLILREIDARDRWRGTAWILDAGKLHAERRKASAPVEAEAGVSRSLA